VVQTSFFWEGLVTGDATLAPYSTDRYHTNWQILFTEGDNEGLIDNYLNELVVTGISGGISVASGGALVDGSFYENTSAVTVVVPPPITDPRIDRIVLRKDWGNQTIRIFRIAGTENPAPTAPALEQTAGSLWDIPLAQVLITITGAITVTDERESAITPLAPPAGLFHIETIVADGSLTQFDFSDISQKYVHLTLEYQLRHSKNVPVDIGDTIGIRFNGDSGNNYSAQLLSATNAVASAGAQALFSFARSGLITTAQALANFASQGKIFIANYTRTDLYKNIVSAASFFANSAVADFISEQSACIWLKNSAIERLTLFNGEDLGGAFIAGSTVSLYGIV